RSEPPAAARVAPEGPIVAFNATMGPSGAFCALRQANGLHGEVDLDGGLLHGLGDHQRAVSRVVAVELERNPALAEPVEVVLDLADRAARIVVPGQHEHGDLDVVDV